jgi:AraC-like DNA-binding protein
MKKESLPIYQIPDFETNRPDASAFYHSRLGRHLHTHHFIQKPHKHNFYILLLFTAGSGTHAIDIQSYSVEAGAFFFLAPGQVHSWQLSEDCEGHILFFSTEFYSFGFPSKNLLHYPFFSASEMPSRLLLPAKQQVDVERLFEAMEAEILNPASSKKEMLRSYLEILLITLSRIYESAYGLKTENRPSQNRQKALESAIETHFRSQHQASFYSDLLNLSLKQLNRQSKTFLGKTVSQLVIDRIILEAQRLLTYSDKNISEIASQLGFEDPSYFSRLFRKKSGSTPEQFRKSTR